MVTHLTAFGRTFNRHNLSGGTHNVVAVMRVIARAFTFASLFFSVWFVFLFFVSPSTLHSMARYTALHSDGIAVWMVVFLGLMVVYLVVVGLSAFYLAMDRFEKRSPERAQTLWVVVALITMLLMGSFVVYAEVTRKPVVTAPPPIVAVQPQSQALLHIEVTAGNLVHTKNIVGAAKIERLGPGYYQIRMDNDRS